MKKTFQRKHFQQSVLKLNSALTVKSQRELLMVSKVVKIKHFYGTNIYIFENQFGVKIKILE